MDGVRISAAKTCPSESPDLFLESDDRGFGVVLSQLLHIHNRLAETHGRELACLNAEISALRSEVLAARSGTSQNGEKDLALGARPCTDVVSFDSSSRAEVMRRWPVFPPQPPEIPADPCVGWPAVPAAAPPFAWHRAEMGSLLSQFPGLIQVSLPDGPLSNVAEQLSLSAPLSERSSPTRQERLTTPVEISGHPTLDSSNRENGTDLFVSVSSPTSLPRLRSSASAINFAVGFSSLHDLAPSCTAVEEEEEEDAPCEDFARSQWTQAWERHLSARLEKKSAWSRWFGHLAVHMPDQVPGTLLARLVQDGRFTAVCALLVIANTVFIGYESESEMRSAVTGEELPAMFEVVNQFFSYVFLLELILRIVALQWWWIVGPDWRWNLLDLAIVVSSLVQEVLSNVNVSFIRIFRIVRVARIVRVVRIFRELRRMVCAIVACMASLAWAFLLVILIMYVFAIFFVQGAAAFIREHPDSPEVEDMRFWYKNMTMTMFSLLLCISGGRDWWDVLEPLLAISWIYGVAFAFYVIFIVFGVLNVLTGVFLESATEFLDKDLVVQAEMMRKNMFLKEMQAFFNEFDKSSIGSISWVEFEHCLESEEVLAYLASHQLDCYDAFSLFQLIDKDGRGQIDISAFIQGCLRLKGPARSMDVAVLMGVQERQGLHLQQLEDSLGSVLTLIQQRAAASLRASAADARAPAQPAEALGVPAAKVGALSPCHALFHGMPASPRMALLHP